MPFITRAHGRATKHAKPLTAEALAAVRATAPSRRPLGVKGGTLPPAGRHEGRQLHPAFEQVPGHPHAAAVCSEALAQACGLCRGADSSIHLAGFVTVGQNLLLSEDT